MEDKGETYKPHEEETKWQSCMKMIWNSETKECLGRTGLSWLKITVFYIVFYACLSAFWLCMLVVFYQTLENDQPKWKLDSSRIGSSPGLGFRPSPPQDNIDSTLIWFNATRNETVDYWVSNLNEYLTPYRERDTGGIVQNCGLEQASKDRACHFEFKTGPEHPCSPERKYGYPEGMPCVLIKLNRIYDWVPESYDEPPPDLAKLVKKQFEKTVFMLPALEKTLLIKTTLEKLIIFRTRVFNPIISHLSTKEDMFHHLCSFSLTTLHVECLLILSAVLGPRTSNLTEVTG